MRGGARVRYYVGRGGSLFVSMACGLGGEGGCSCLLAPRAAQTSTYCRTESEGTLHSHRRGEVKHSWPSRPGARAACQRASPGGTWLSRGAVSRAVGGRRERAYVFSVQQAAAHPAGRLCRSGRMAGRVRGGRRARRAAARASRGRAASCRARRALVEHMPETVCRRLAKGVDCQ